MQSDTNIYDTYAWTSNNNDSFNDDSDNNNNNNNNNNPKHTSEKLNTKNIIDNFDNMDENLSLKDDEDEVFKLQDLDICNVSDVEDDDEIHMSEYEYAIAEPDEYFLDLLSTAKLDKNIQFFCA